MLQYLVCIHIPSSVDESLEHINAAFVRFFVVDDVRLLFISHLLDLPGQAIVHFFWSERRVKAEQTCD
jgi:hypothetical protein